MSEMIKLSGKHEFMRKLYFFINLAHNQGIKTVRKHIKDMYLK